MYPRHQQSQHSLHHPRPRQPSSTTSSTLLASSTSGSEAWMPPTRASTSTSRSIFSETDNETEGRKYQETDMGTVVDHDRPLIDLDDDPTSKTLAPRPLPQVMSNTGHEATPTPGEKLRLLLRQMEAEVRDTTPAPPPPSTGIHQERRSSASSDDHAPMGLSTQSKSNWREGRRIGALPKERRYTPPSSPERQHQVRPRHSEDEQEEEQEILDDSPPTPPLRITNPYLYASRKVSDERRSSTSPRQPSRAAVLHASTSRSPPSDPVPSNPTPLQTYLARTPSSPSSPSRKGKERETTPTPGAPSPARIRKPTRTPRKWSIELAPDDSVLFAEGLEAQADQEMELDLDESADPPWGWGSGAGSSEAGESSASDAGEGERGVGGSVNDQTARQKQHQNQNQNPRNRSRSDREESLPELPALPVADIDAEAESTDESAEDESLHPPPVRPPSRSRSRFSQSPSLRRSQSPSFTTAVNKSISPSKSHEQSSSTTRRHTPPVEPTLPRSPMGDATSPSHSQSRHERSTSTSFTRRTKTKPPPVKPILTPEPVRITPATPPKQTTAHPSPIPGQTPRPPGAWYSASKPRPNPNVRFSPLRQGHIPPSPETSASASGDISIHRLVLSPSKPKHSPSPNRSSAATTTTGSTSVSTFRGGADVGETSFTRRLVQGMTKTLTRSSPPKALPPPSNTLAEAQLALRRAAEASALARRKVEYSQRQWLEALSVAGNGTAQVIKHGWTWTRWVWWISIELMLLWGVFRVTMEYASPSSNYRLLDPSSAPAFALSIPLPSAVSAFIIPSGNRRSSANFFDLLEQLEVWKYLDMAGITQRQGDEDGANWMRKVGVRVPI